MTLAQTPEELLAAVPVREDGGFKYIDLADIPEPWRRQFRAALYGSTCPVIEGVEQAAYPHDWQHWVLHGFPRLIFY